MSVLFSNRASSTSDLIPTRRHIGWRGAPRKREHLAHSAAWACISLRAGLISTMPIDAYRRVGKVQVEVPKPPILVDPGGSHVDITEWMYSTQSDLDSTGNTFGLITERDGNNKPARIDLVPQESVTVRSKGGNVTYWFDGKEHQRDEVWHERQYTSSGLAVGLSPIGYAAMTLYQHATAQEFATSLFGGNVLPSGILKHSESRVDPKDAEQVKARYRLAIENNDIFVVGKDWEFTPANAIKAQAEFIATMGFADLELTRFFGVPADLVDVAAEGSHITYANITQRNLQFLIMNLGPAIIRREKALSRLMAKPRFVKLNSDALLRMDPETVAKTLGQQVRDRIIAPSEARELLNRTPFTDEQIEEFKELFPNEFNGATTDSTGGVTPPPPER